MAQPPEVYVYCFRDGLIRTGSDVPQGAIRIYGITEGFTKEQLAESHYGFLNGKDAYVPGVAEASTDTAALDALRLFQKKIVEIRRQDDIENRNQMIENLPKALAQAASEAVRKKTGMKSLFED